ncbi:putative signal recognition particle SRP54 domain superfamily [Helianthus annuus]|nr:putative signal recognition particle SRP54 domain superfamily [Helianthus annuus]
MIQNIYSPNIRLNVAFLVSDFCPKITIKIVESLWDDIHAGKLKSGTEIKASDALKKSSLDILTTKGAKTELKLGFRKPAVTMIVGAIVVKSHRLLRLGPIS